MSGRKSGTEMMGEVRLLRAVPYDYRWDFGDYLIIRIICLLTTDKSWFWWLHTFLPLLQREEPRPVWEDAENGDIRRAGAWYFHLFHFVFVFTLYFVFLTLSGVNDDIIIRLGPKCDSARSAVSAECFRFFYQWKYYFLLKVDFDSLAVDESVSKSFSLSKDL